jgi:glycerol-3-phosphate dehydrogenase
VGWSPAPLYNAGVTSPRLVEPPFQRVAMVERLASEHFDVLVIGGGITGAGVALDAASRGLRTALVEAEDFASGTSSRSSKLVHGGIRYLQSGDVRLVYEALRERKRLRHNAPHLVKILPFLLPILTRDGLINRRVARALGSAMWMYDLTGGWRIGKLHKRLGGDAAHAHMPTLPRDNLAYGYIYYDATVDDARLVLAVARSAAAHGAAVANRCRVVALDQGGSGRVGGATVDVGSGRRIDVAAETVVNATGVWTDEVRTLEDGTHADTIRPAKGVHLTLPWALVRNDIAAVIAVPGDKRSLFVVPWGPLPDGSFRHTYIGTTDTDYAGPLDDPPCTSEDIDYVLGAVNAALGTDIGVGDITGVWAGLRPLVRAASSGRTADLSRRHRVTIGSRGVVTVTGGKLTTYRQMAEDTVDAVVRLLGRGSRCRTRRLHLLGAEGFSEGRTGTPEAHLADRYGSLAGMIDRITADDADLGAPLVPGLPYVRAEAVYAARHEMATMLTDVLIRRTRAHLLDRGATLTAAPAIAELLAGELGWDSTERQRQLDDYRQLVAKEQDDAMATA